MISSQWTKDRQQRRAERLQEFNAKHQRLGTIGVVYCAFPLPPDYDAGQIGKDAVLFLRCGQNMRCAMQAMEDMGFKYKTSVVVRLPADLCALILVGTRGKIPAPAPGTQFSSVLDEESDISKMIDCYFPNTPRIEIGLKAKG